jgi:hypothetical protein
MKMTIAWLNAAIGQSDLGGMSYYKVNDNVISATDGQITACAPWKWGGKFFVPGEEFEKILKRLPGDPQIVSGEDSIKLKAGRFSGTIKTLPLTEWSYPGVESASWQPLPQGLGEMLKALRPFVAEDDNLAAWARSIALAAGWAFATNNIVIAGAPCSELGECQALLPSRAVDFLLGRLEGLESWIWDENFMAFRWNNGAWMRTQLIVGQFPEKAAELVRFAAKEKTTQPVTDEFLEALNRVADLASDTVLIYADRIEAAFNKAVVEEDIECRIPKNAECSIWGARFLLPALQAAKSWSPDCWPERAPFKGPIVSGYVVGRRA